MGNVKGFVSKTYNVELNKVNLGTNPKIFNKFDKFSTLETKLDTFKNELGNNSSIEVLSKTNSELEFFDLMGYDVSEAEIEEIIETTIENDSELAALEDTLEAAEELIRGHEEFFSSIDKNEMEKYTKMFKDTEVVGNPQISGDITAKRKECDKFAQEHGYTDFKEMLEDYEMRKGLYEQAENLKRKTEREI